MKKVITFITALVVAAIFYACDTNNQSEDAVVSTITEVKELPSNVGQSACAYCGDCVDYIKHCTPAALPNVSVNTWEDKKKIINTYSPSYGYVAIMPSNEYPNYGHMAYVEEVKPSGKVKIREGNYEGRCNTREVDKSKITGYYKPKYIPM